MCVILVDMVVCMFLLDCVDVMVMPSACEASCSVAGDCGMSDVYIKIVGERTPA